MPGIPLELDETWPTETTHTPRVSSSCQTQPVAEQLSKASQSATPSQTSTESPPSLPLMYENLVKHHQIFDQIMSNRDSCMEMRQDRHEQLKTALRSLDCHLSESGTIFRLCYAVYGAKWHLGVPLSIVAHGLLENLAE
ncbi:hypothetical protein MPDQ_001555 [Monascus purpureus]|uniref:Uncharacterized protein n=1 Tax=Monascus purpureus TaxID=5098 RepID=A0A507QRQ4_MONPU|nr:hypothetical protein MPDQ_001555 [Monascus purpureus]BDD61534.1 hypothetical protein MAP00_006575 [Monascus purpureus]